MAEKISLFIDGANLYSTCRALQFDIDFSKLKKHFSSLGQLVHINYYTAVRASTEVSSIMPLIDWLSYNGFNVVKKQTKEFQDSEGRLKIKGNMDVEMTLDAYRLAEHIDHIYLFSGDGDFTYLVRAIQERGKKVTVVSSNHTKPSLVADELRRQANDFIDLYTLRDKLERDREDRHPPTVVGRSSLTTILRRG